jgi:hypothetical protein
VQISPTLTTVAAQEEHIAHLPVLGVRVRALVLAPAEESRCTGEEVDERKFRVLRGPFPSTNKNSP